MDAVDRSFANRRIVKRLLLAVVAMFGFGFALVPLYDVFCDITGINGKTGRLEREQALSQEVDEERLVTVEFLASVNGDLPWDFRPTIRRIKVHPGAVTEVTYTARNRTAEAVVGQAVPSVAPGLAAKYFSKTECFCFTLQTLGPEEEKDMPLRFVVDPDLPKDIGTVSLSYTFFQAKDAAPVSTLSGESGSLESIM